MRGTLAQVVPTANTDTVIYTATVNCSFAEIDIFVTNPNVSNDATIKVAISADGTIAANEYIENGAKVAALGGGHEIISRKISPGDRVIVNTNQSDTVFRVEGSEEVLY